MTNWNYGDVWETVAEIQPDAIAVSQGNRYVTWREFDRGADGIAQTLLDLGVVRQDKVAIFLYNCPEYLQASFAAFKIGLVPINTNYRYGDDELTYLWNNADAVAAVFHGAFAERIERILARVPGIRSWIWVDDGSGPCPAWATPYDEAAKAGRSRTAASWGRSGDDLFMIYTGGTTGSPKGVMWRQDDLFVRLLSGSVRHYPVEGGIEGVRQSLTAGAAAGPGAGAGASPGAIPRSKPVTLLPACPLMHGTGWFTADTTLADGGRVALLEQRTYDPHELLDTVEREKVNGLVIVGDPFSRPLLAALDARPGHWDLSSLVVVISSGAMWSESIKRELLSRHPGMLLVDVFSSSEALGMGMSVTAAGSATGPGTGTGTGPATAKFTLGPDVKVFTEDGAEVTPGSGEIGVLALRGRNPLGYYKDGEKSDRTFKMINGERYSVPGDFAQVDTDGTIHLLGRGSVCINSGGEKIFPEEVEEALKTHQAVGDAVVVGIPDPHYGEQVVGIVELTDGAAQPTESELIDHVKDRLANYKSPRRVRVVQTIGRAANGKVDYRRHRAESIQELEPAG